MVDAEEVIRDEIHAFTSFVECGAADWRDVVARVEAKTTGRRHRRSVNTHPDARFTTRFTQADRLDVRRRAPSARTPQSRRRQVLTALIAAVALVLAIPALAFRSQIIDFFGGPPAPTSIVVTFNRVAIAEHLPRRGNSAFPQRARRITSVEIEGKKSTLYVAPTIGGGFCALWTSNYVSRCFAKRPLGLSNSKTFSRKPRPSYADLGWSAFYPQEGIDTVEGEVFVRGASVEVAYADGKKSVIPYVWVTAPIRAGFFLFSIPTDRRTGDKRPTALTVTQNGRTLAHMRLEDVAKTLRVVNHHDRWGLVIQTSPEAVWSKRRLLYSFNTADGRLIEGWVMPSRLGATRRCVVTTYSSHCESAVTTAAEIDLYVLGATSPGQSVLIQGEVSAAVARLELRFQDGERLLLKPKEGVVLSLIPSKHYRHGHRLIAATGFDASGRRIATESFDAHKRNVYPCARPKNYGAGVEMCP